MCPTDRAHTHPFTEGKMEVVWDLMGSAEAKHYRGSSAKARLYLESGIRKTNASPAVPVSLPGPRE